MLLKNEDSFEDFEDLASHHTALLLLVLLEVQLHHFQDSVTSSVAAPAAVGLPASDRSAGTAACNSSTYILKQQQQHWQKHGSSASEQQYRHSLLQALGLPTGQQQWEKLCRTASSSSSSSSDRDYSAVLIPA